jgi:hypothetical protein
MNLIIKWIKDWNVNTKDLPKFQEDMVSYMKSLYTDKILPVMKKWEEKFIDVKDIANKSFNEAQQLRKNAISLNEKSIIKEVDWLVESLSKTKPQTLPELESLKQSIGAKLYTLEYSWRTKDYSTKFLENVNNNIQSEIESVLASIGWKWVKEYKSIYGALARNTDNLNREVNKQATKRWLNLLQWVWMIQWTGQVTEWVVTRKPNKILKWLTTLATSWWINVSKDPDVLLGRLMKKIYPNTSDTIIKKAINWIKQKSIWKASSEVWQFLDEKVNK